MLLKKMRNATLTDPHRCRQWFDDNVKTLSGMLWRKLLIESALLKAVSIVWRKC
jgi:hypothetical protein